MDAIGDLGSAVGDGIGTIIGRGVEGAAAALDAAIAGAATLLPGPLLPIAALAGVVLVVWLVFRH